MTPSVFLGRCLMRIRPAPLAAFLKQILCIRRLELATSEGRFWVDPASYQGQALLTAGIYEPEMLATVKRFLPTGGTFVDLGANEGYFSVVAARQVGPTGRVLAIEPQARLQPVLRRNFSLNGSDRVTLAPVAVSDHPGTGELHLTPSMNNSASGLRAPTRYALPRQSVPLATLAQVFAQAGIERCDLLKIDIEGWEYEAILGSQALFAEHRIRYLALELHPHLLTPRGLDASAITAFLARCDYREIPGRGHLLLALS